MQHDQKLSFTLAEAVISTGLTRSRIYQAIGDGSLTTFKAGRRRMVSRKALEAYVAKLERDSAKVGAA